MISRISRSAIISMLTVFIFSTLFIHPVSLSAASKSEDSQELLSLIGEALVQVRGGDIPSVKDSLVRFERQWNSNNRSQDGKNKLAAAVNEELAKTGQLLDQGVDRETLYRQIVALAKATDQYAGFFVQTELKVDRTKIKALILRIDGIQSQVNQQQWEQARANYQDFVSEWSLVEKPVREQSLQAYGAIETHLSLARAALYADPANAPDSLSRLDALKASIQDYLDGNWVAASSASDSSLSLASLVSMLDQADLAVSEQRTNDAKQHMEAFISAWPAAEGEVATRSEKVYRDTENRMTEILTLLVSNPPDTEKAGQLIQNLKQSLEPFAHPSSYTTWDAFVILFREGMEAILIIATLLAYLKRTNHGDKKGWVWGGLGAGLLFSAGFSVILTALFANLESGINREKIEGFSGLAAVIFMLSIGAWLHKQSNIRAWNRYLNQKMQKAMTGGTPWLLAIVSFTAVFREGAETILFYSGMAFSIALADLLLGIGCAVAVLFLTGYVLIKFSVKIPIRPFFLTAGLLIYYLAFKFTGVSLHALQVTGLLPAHAVDGLIPIGPLGIYPTWETVLPQFVLLMLILLQSLRMSVKKAA